MFSLLQYRAFVAVAECRSITGAASRLNRTPSAISMLVKQFEERLEAELFLPGSKAVLTQVGEAVLEEARALVAHDDRVSREIRAIARGHAGHVSVASIPSVSNAFIPQTLRALWQKHPDMTFDVLDLDSASVPRALLNETAEIAVCTFNGLDPEFAFVPLFQDSLDVVCSAGHPLAKLGRPVAWSEILQERFVGNSSYQQLEAARLESLTNAQSAFVPSFTSLLAIVRTGEVVTVLPRINRGYCGASVSFIPISDGNAKRTVGVLSRTAKRKSPVAMLFISALKSAIGDARAELDLVPLEGLTSRD